MIFNTPTPTKQNITNQSQNKTNLALILNKAIQGVGNQIKENEKQLNKKNFVDFI